MANTYTITNPAHNPKRVFILQKSELEKRLDPEYYGHIYNEYDKKLRLKPFKKFSQIIKSINNGFDFRDYKESGTPYLKVANIRKGEFRFDKIQYIDFNSSEISKNIQLKKGNILLTRKGTFGYAIALEQDYDFVISSEVFYIEIQQDVINPKFLEIFFNSEIGQAQFDKNKIGAIMGSLSQDAIRELKIPAPTIEIQKEIVSIYQKYISQKQTNEAEASTLLASIDDYLLGELGITLPQGKTYFNVRLQNNVAEPKAEYGNYRFVKEKFELNQQSKLVQQKRMFTTNFSEVSGSRLDPDYHKSYYKEFYNTLKSGVFGFVKLKEITTKIYTGKGLYDYLPKGIPYLNVNNIKKYEVVFENVNYLDEYNKYENIISKNQIITGRVGTIGNFAKYEEVFNALISDNVFALTMNEVIVNIDYANYFLNSVLSLTQIKRNSRGAVQEVISTNVLNEIQIPVPPLDKQKEIADHITNIRNQAQALKDQTKDLLKKASEEIEAILLN